MKLPLVLGAVVLAALGSTPARAKGLTVEDMLAMQRLSAPTVSPDGKRVAFAVRDTDYAANRGRVDIWVANVDGTGTRRLTTHPDNDSDPAWSRDSRFVYFSSTRSGSAQVWKIDASGGEAEQVTKLPVDVNGFKLHPDGKRIVVAMDVWPAARTLADSVKLDDAKAKTKSSARVYDQLLFRHWDQWEDGRYSHLFMWTPPELGGKADDARDLTQGQATDSPTHPFGGMEEVDLSPDGKTLAFVARVGGRETAWKTNSDVFLLALDGNNKPVNVTSAYGGYDNGPTFSPDGKWLALRSMARAGYEADRERIVVLEMATKKLRVVTEAWDRSAGSITWSADGKTIYTSTDHVGNHAIFAIDVVTGGAKLVVEKGNNSDPQRAGDRLVFQRDTLVAPTELFTMKPDGSDVRAITHLNDERVKKITWGQYEQFSFKGAKGDTVHGYAMRPAGHDGKTKVPLAFLIHGGPQGSFGDHWHYRWNAQAYAGRGYGVVMIDFHGSTGYGQAFTDAIRGDWGGAPYEDLMMGLDAAIKKYTWIDDTRLLALGASYGGYMINWINGKTDRFKALVCHDGNIDERMAYYDTEELWFPEWEHGGPATDKTDSYTKHNPIDLVKNWKTPTLVIHGGLDFRVVDTQGMSTFTALQRKGVASRFIHFPDENHWVLKPQNSKVWHDEVLAWLDKYSKRR
ncbi:MAG: S9 family peptidase [Deltaproteobacteria bacterium]|nr:S9 family peptidase [Deltaproteobacteria bacterium]